MSKLSPVSKKPSGMLAAQFKGVAVYDDGIEKAAAADYKTVVAGMTRDRMDKFFFPGLIDALQDEPLAEHRKVMHLLEGDDPSGFRVSIVGATANGARVYLPMVDDQLQGRTLIVGPGPATPGRIAENVTYVDATQEGARDAINNFLADGAVLRAERNLLGSGGAIELKENLIMATSSAAVIAPSGVIAGSTTLGDVLPPIALGKTDVALYAVAAQQPRKFKL